MQEAMMAHNPQARQFAEISIHNRDLVNYYLHKLQEADWHKAFYLGAIRLNSVAWCVAHLTWAEDFFVLKATGGPMFNIPWLELFRMGADAPEPEAFPHLEDIQREFHTVHEAAIEHLITMEDEDLDKANLVDLSFGKNDDSSRRMVLCHQIRHEGTHCGHLSWLAKLHGIKTV